MQSIEIYTSQNVAIDYELASLKDRILAFLLDALILFAGLGIFFSISAAALGSNGSQYVLFIIVIPVFFFYSMSMEIFNDGQSLGKTALNIKVAKLNGQEFNISDFLIRWVFRIVDIYFSIGGVAVIFVSSSDKNQRLGDLLAGTVVIKSKPAKTIGLNTITDMYATQKQKVKYPMVVQKFNEADMLLVKEALDRHKKYSNEAHNTAIDEIAKRICKELNIEKQPKDKSKFLRTVLQDYIVLTR